MPSYVWSEQTIEFKVDIEVTSMSDSTLAGAPLFDISIGQSANGDVQQWMDVEENSGGMTTVPLSKGKKNLAIISPIQLLSSSTMLYCNHSPAQPSSTPINIYPLTLHPNHYILNHSLTQFFSTPYTLLPN